MTLWRLVGTCGGRSVGSGAGQTASEGSSRPTLTPSHLLTVATWTLPHVDTDPNPLPGLTEVSRGSKSCPRKGLTEELFRFLGPTPIRRTGGLTPCTYFLFFFNNSVSVNKMRKLRLRQVNSLA